MVFFIPWRVVAEESGAAHFDLLCRLKGTSNNCHRSSGAPNLPAECAARRECCGMISSELASWPSISINDGLSWLLSHLRGEYALERSWTRVSVSVQHAGPPSGCQ
jgi:hypothetical protein